MIISASRRTDIPAFYPEWFMNRIRDGYCSIINPFNNKHSVISLKKDNVDLIIFWTKDPGPIMKHLDELDEREYKYYFQYTLTGYSKVWEPNVPDAASCIDNFKRLARRIGRDKVILRYDPIIFSDITDYDYHYTNFTRLIDLLKDSTQRVTISILDDYRGSRGRIKKLEGMGIKLMDNPMENENFKELMKCMSSYAVQNGLEIYSCAEPIDLKNLGILHGKCIDDDYIKKVFHIDASSEKDKGQRKECGCIESRDIGSYDTCPHLCRYCYANRSDALSLKNYKNHDKNSPSLI